MRKSPFVTTVLPCVFMLALTACTAIDPYPSTPIDENRFCNKPVAYEGFESKDIWKACKTFDEKLDVCQIPVTVAETLTTDALIQTCINHPLAGMYLAYDDEFEIVKILSGQNNAFKELLHRCDAAWRLVDYYEGKPDISLCQMHFLELLLGSGLFPSLFEEPLSGRLKVAAESQLAYRRMMPERYSIQSRKTAGLLVRELEKGIPPTMKSAGNLLMELAVPKYSIDTKAAGDFLYTIMLHTPFGTTLTGYVREDFTSSEVTSHDNTFMSAYPNAVLIEHSSAAYECHSYAWNISFGGDTCQIVSPSPYIDDKSFVEVNSYSIADVLYSVTSIP